MAYVQPNSIIQLFQGINLDNRYLHTIYFANVNAQDSWFANRVTISFQAQSYIRYTRNQVKIPCDVTSILGCTYMRFLNDRAGDKWFYAFINNVEYVNENNALVTYEIDVMQTWFMQGGGIRPCMVLREHVNNDTFGINLESEPIGSDVYDADFIESFDSLFYVNGVRSKSLIIETTGDPQLPATLIKQGIFHGSRYYSHTADSTFDSTAIYNELTNLLGSWDSGEQEQEIIDMYTVPTPIANQANLGFQDYACQMTRPTSYDNYTPKNNKLFMYPFSYLLCTTHDGNSGTFRWEYFDGTNIDFRAIATPMGGGQIRVYPRAYNGQEDNMDSAITYSDFPKSSFNYDAYQAWIANGGKTKLENAEELVEMRGISAEIGAVTSVLTGGIATSSKARSANITGNIPTALQAVSMGASTLGNLLTSAIDTSANWTEAQNKINYEWKDAIYRPNINVGKSAPAIAMGADILNFYFYHVHVRDDEVKRLDDFLSCYGYAVNAVKQPNLTGRRYFNFVQTQNAVITGAMPASSKEAIGRIFDGGITFWHDGDQVGNYAQSVSNGTINNPIV